MEQNKIRSYILYALGEIFLVVIGILIALQVNNWNESRKTMKKEQTSLKKIAQNLQEDIDLLQEIIQEDSTIYENLSKLSNQIMDANSVDDLDPSSSARFRVPLFYPNQSAFENLLSSGQIEIIQNDSLTQRLQLYYRSIKIIQEGTDFSLRNYSRDIEKFFMEFDHVRDHPKLKKKAIAAYRDDPFLLNSLYYKNGLILRQISNYSKIMVEAQGILALIENEISS
ncbi:DUF6090 family protein [Algoriphagus halophilus]|nr:DUF6090 family protein [Algoriphagus halophilus]